jgi:mRNA-degrading endonuclease YafQ of YafQ-DinJ toxin-antitoxin module
MEVRTSSEFRRKFKKLSKELKQKAYEREKWFRNNPFDSRLKTHRRHGKYSRFWAFSVTRSYRIMFEFIDEYTVGFVDIGDHSIYK